MLGSVRVRLTLWYLVVFGTLLIVFSGFIYVSLSRSLYGRIDDSLSNSAATVSSVLEDEVEENRGNLASAARETINELHLPGTYIAIGFNGKVLISNFPRGVDTGQFERRLPGSQTRDAIQVASAAWTGPGLARSATVSVSTLAGKCQVIVVRPLDDLTDQLRSLRRMFYLGLPAALIIASIGGLLLAKKSLAPVVVMSNQAARIGANNLHDRLAVSKKTDELGRLAVVFNDLLSRLDGAFENMKQFMADASHELRTPLSIIRGEADVALSQERDAIEYREALSVIQDEARRLSRIVDDMMELARADAGQRPLDHREFYLNDLMEECCRAVHVLADAKGVGLSYRPCEDIGYFGDEEMIRRMVLNLLDNAIKYTPPGGSVAATLCVESETVKMAVSDTGIGIPEEAASRIFQRFYRAEKARSRAGGGSGLGLAIARWVAEAHRGSIGLETHPGYGSTFTVSLPRIEAAPLDSPANSP
ncbi:MAG TPA: ATP-binding protein [Blastocatellia bacterium]|nr:ATP-binding protein [Blastocatellia bacterium]